MRTIKTGDPCPICGRAVTSTDHTVLETLSAWADIMDRLGISGPEKEDEHETGSV